MKHSRIARFITLLLLAALLTTAAASAATVKLAYEGGALNLRSGPGTNYTSKGTLHDGDHVDILVDGDVWTKVRTDSGKTGYIKNLYISGNGGDYASGTDYFDSRFTVYTTANVNMRSGASTDTVVITKLGKDTKLTALGENGGFYLVSTSKGTQGYVHRNYLSRSKVNGGSSSGSSSETRTVTASYVRMREGGGLHYDVVATLPRGTKVTVLKQGNYWTKVQYKSYIGWIKKAYLK